jgi:hypothetical protein
MIWTHDAPLEVGLDRLEWALDKAGRQYYQREAIGPVIRALLSVEKALRMHAAAAEAPAGPFTRLIDPSSLPFTPLSQHVGDLRREHQALERRVAGLRRRLEGAIRSVPAHSGPTDDAENALHRHLGSLCKDVRPLMADIKRHRDTEKELILSSDV